MLFVGGFEHPPNVDAALALVNDVMPLVWERLGDVPVTIAGSKPTPEVEALAGPNVEITGWVEDLQPLIDGARAMAAPLRYGAGMKGKVTQSLGAGLPVVTTPTGAEGLGAAGRPRPADRRGRRRARRADRAACARTTRCGGSCRAPARTSCGGSHRSS